MAGLLVGAATVVAAVVVVLVVVAAAATVVGLVVVVVVVAAAAAICFYCVVLERIPNLTGEQSDGITVFRIPPMTSLMLHRCRTGAINLQRWWQSPSAAISESDWLLYRAGISRRITSCTVVSWRCVLL
ncbi:hypothetical protein ANN_07861 [Periplaneta americana]|uniref:Secreted peptide n=1 Tax=Periplaneta americana TaxID=6978 RepID=A0ABQ8T0G3_PERAM|nr:hypothetical protein ANN_07861 [Periplaneta americana]